MVGRNQLILYFGIFSLLSSVASVCHEYYVNEYCVNEYCVNEYCLNEFHVNEYYWDEYCVNEYCVNEYCVNVVEYFGYQELQCARWCWHALSISPKKPPPKK